MPLVLFKNKSNKVPFVLYSNTKDESIAKRFSYLADLPHVQYPIIFLPDFHYKPLLETPSSSVVRTRQHFSLSLTSPSQNCGMSLILTPMSKEDMSPLFIERFMSKIKSVIPLRNASPILSREEVFQALKQGAKWAVKKFGLSEDITNHIEYKGNLFGENKLSLSYMEHAIPNEIIELARSRFGIIGGGNHFLELQVVDEIFDDTIAKAWGLHQDQIVIMVHTGSDALGAYLGRLYAHRRKTSLRQHFEFYRRKLTFHFSHGPIYSFPERISYYLLPRPYRFIDPDIPEGERVLIAINSAANFGFANRIAIFNAIRNALKHILNDRKLEINLLYDCSHNSIYRENVNANTVWAHRHNACRVYPPSLLKKHRVFALTGQPVILPGTNQTSSFICAGREGASATHFTVDHGLGAIQKRYENHGSAKNVDEVSYLFNYEKDGPEKIPRLCDTAINEAVEILNETDIIRTIIRLRPLATLKGPKYRVI